MGRQYLRLEHDPADGVVNGFIEFGGRTINLNRMAVAEGFNYSYLWRVFHGFRIPSIPYAIRLADCCHMSVDDFLKNLNAVRRASAIQD